MTQDKYPERDPLEEYWTSHGRPSPFKGEPILNWEDMRDQIEATARDPWTSGRYALAAVAWGLIALVVLGYGAGP